MTRTLDLCFHPSQHPRTVQAKLQTAIDAGVLPARFLYDSPAQAARWLAYHAAWSPSRTESDLLRLYDRASEAVLDEICPTFGYVSLGCGGGKKDARFVSSARSRNTTLERVTLSDTSPSLVMAAMLESPHSAPRGLVVDLEASVDRPPFTGELPTVWTAFGMVPNLDHRAFLGWLAEVMGPEDRALVSANLHPAPWPEAGSDILPQYDNPEARAWYRGALGELGLSDATLDVTGTALQPDGAAWRVEVTARAEADAELAVFDRVLAFASGRPLRVFHSNRFTAAAFSSALASAGLSVVHNWLFDGEEEGIWMVRRDAAGSGLGADAAYLPS